MLKDRVTTMRETSVYAPRALRHLLSNIRIKGMAPGGKEEHELGWFGWSELRDISPDGHKIVFDGYGYNSTAATSDSSQAAQFDDAAIALRVSRPQPD